MTIAEFLNARLNEEERAAKAATPGPWAPSGHSVITADDIEIGDVPRRDASHIARHDPARVLREIAAKRGILEFFEHADGDSAWWYEDAVLGQLASVYADHPDYQQGWAP